jgi:tetratricopeptide (TPR) repeat protein
MGQLKFVFALLVVGVSGFAGSNAPTVPQCFKVHSLIRMDEDHYWANWTNACPYTIDSVYVLVKFSGRSVSGPANGVWALHFVTPGTHQVTRFTAPINVADFDSVQVAKITTDPDEALHQEGSAEYRASRNIPGAVGDPGPSVQPVRESDRPVAALSAREHHDRGRELLNKGRYRDSIEELSEAIQQQPDFGVAYNARGFAYFMLRQYSRALTDLDEAIRLNPQYQNAYQNRSHARKAAGDSAGSSADAMKALALAGTNPN